MKICFIPIDNRPVCYTLVQDILAVDKNIKLIIPPREFLGDLKKIANTSLLQDWLNNLPCFDIAIVALDTIAYGGLVSSRRSNESFEAIKSRIEVFKNILASKGAKIYAFSSIMRISNNNYNEEEKDYWSQYGKKIFDYSYLTHKNAGAFGFESCVEKLIPDDILNDYMRTRRRNFEINKIYLEWQKEGFFESLVFSKDDCAEYGFNVMEAQELEKLGAKTKTGADEIPLTLLSGALYDAKNKVFVDYTESEHIHKISNYEDVALEKSVLSQLELGGYDIVDDPQNADFVLVVNNFINKQGELVMGWDTRSYDKKFVVPNSLYAIADVRYANGADNAFVEQLLESFDLEKFLGYSAWNTTANTLGSLLLQVRVMLNAKNSDVQMFKRSQMIRFLDDWAYQANVRGMIEHPVDITDMMRGYEKIICKKLEYNLKTQISYKFPWDRKFEIEVVI